MHRLFVCYAKILRATGKPYHAQCFCCVACQKSLDGIPFTVDASMQIHCIECFHQKFAPRCHACHRAILPVAGQEETVRIVALDRSYHIECYRCEVSRLGARKREQSRLRLSSIARIRSRRNRDAIPSMITSSVSNAIDCIRERCWPRRRLLYISLSSMFY